MIDITKDIEPLTTFRNNSVKTMQRLNKTRPTINGKPEAAIQYAAAYGRLLDIATTLDANEGIRQGLEELHRGTRDAFNPITPLG